MRSAYLVVLAPAPEISLILDRSSATEAQSPSVARMARSANSIGANAGAP